MVNDRNADNKHRPDLEAEDMKLADDKLRLDLKKILTVDSVVIDVGANEGQFIKELIGVVPIQKAYCFEPVPAAFEKLQEYASEEKIVETVCSAVSESEGSQIIFETESNVGSSLLKPVKGQDSKWLTVSASFEVNTVRLDTFIENRCLIGTKPIGLLKSDAQGYDLFVIRSLGKYLNPSYVEAILVEVNFQYFYEGQPAYHEIMSLLDNAGYRLVWVYPHRDYSEWLWWADLLFLGK